MRTAGVTAGCLALSLFLLASGAFLSRVLDHGSAARRLEEVAARLDGRCAGLAAEAARLDRQVALLKRVASQIGEAGSRSEVAPAERPVGGDQGSEGVELEALLSGFEADDKPEPANIARLSAEEWTALVRERSGLPRELRGELLIEGDLDAVLQSPLWNPTGNQPSDKERAELEKLLKQYRYYARISPVERLKKLVEPELQFLRDAGAFVEYPRGTAPPAVEGVYVSHAEESDTPGMDRIYYFHEDDYPEVVHQKCVERERGLETFLEVYRQLNGQSEGRGG